ncbi:hypothetical protein SALBM311S_07467 [Streptomyces alboniger]
MDDLTEMLKGTLEGCVLEIIGSEETYGYAITRQLNELGFADVIEGTVYTILLRLEKNGLVQMTKRPSGVGPPRKFYALNEAGREELAKFWAKWQYVSSRIDRLKEGGDELLGDHHRQRSHQGMEGVRSPGRGPAGRLPGGVGADQGPPLSSWELHRPQPDADPRAALALLEETAAEGQSVHEVLGDDIRGFCAALAGGEGARTDPPGGASS